jgi:hypothetical protein
VRIWISRLLIGVVTAWNLQAALVFIASPGASLHAFELSGAAGEAAVRGVGILFLMWNVPYVTAAWDPARHRLLLALAVIMQSIGLIGEGWILSGLPAGHTALRGSILRFTLFDGAGLALLVAAWGIARKSTGERPMHPNQ